MKMHLYDVGHMTKMAAKPIYKLHKKLTENLKKFLSVSHLVRGNHARELFLVQKET